MDRLHSQSGSHTFMHFEPEVLFLRLTVVVW
jgi:hypothetical protein